ncbi:MAG: ferric reductase-like transmembrane domain-containing protein [bacterium]|nr:ferric reductase-like transmembrane domain-containing protein [bacterium]
MQRLLTHKKDFINIFQVLHVSIFGILALFAYWINLDIHKGVIYEVGVTCGSIAAWFFILTLLPGIARRFKIQHIAFTVLMLFRRQLGVSMFLFGLLHYSAIRLFPVLFGGVPFDLDPPLFEIVGFFTLYSLAPLYITSNDFSVKKLGKWWKRIHRIAYITVWLIFSHVALQQISILALSLGIVALLEVTSHIKHRFSL